MSAAPQVHPFDFSKLPKLRAQEVALRRSLLEAYPVLSQEDTEASFKEFFRRFCQGLSFDMRGKFVTMEEQSLSTFTKNLPQHGVVLQFNAEPQGTSLWLQLDSGLAQTLISHTLGKLEAVSDDAKDSTGSEAHTEISVAASSESALLWPLSEVSQATLEFLALRALKALGGAGESTNLIGPQQLNFQGVWLDPNSIPAKEAGERGLSLKFFLVFKSEAGQVSKGFVTLHLPHPWLTGVLLREDIMTGLGSSLDQAEKDQAISRVSHVNLEMVSELGQVHLQSSDWQQLEAGDVILLDETQAKLGPHGLAGKALLKVSESANQGLLVELIDAQEKLTVKVLDFYGGAL